MLDAKDNPLVVYFKSLPIVGKHDVALDLVEYFHPGFYAEYLALQRIHEQSRCVTQTGTGIPWDYQLPKAALAEMRRHIYNFNAPRPELRCPKCEYLWKSHTEGKCP